MVDHPYIADPQYSTALLSWFDGGLHVLRRVPPDGFVILNVFQAAYGAIFLFALWLAWRAQARGLFRVPRRAVLDTALVAVIALVIGGRLGEAIIYQPEYYFSNPIRLLTNASGFTIHGMIAGVIVAFGFWARRLGRPWLHLLDQTPVIVAFGTILGRVANFMAGDLWGRETGLPWGVRFPMRGPLFRPVYADAEGTTYTLTPGDAGAFLEPWKADQGIQILRDAPALVYPREAADGAMQMVWQVVTTPRHPSQLYQAITEGVVLLVILLVVRARTRTVGMVSAVFLIAYGLLRLTSEFFRQPEPGLGFLFGLTRGQLISMLMALSGAALLWHVRRRGGRIDDLPDPRTQMPTPEVRNS